MAEHVDRDGNGKPRTVMLPDEHYRALSLLVALKSYRSRSEVLEKAIEVLAEQELGPNWANPIVAFVGADR